MGKRARHQRTSRRRGISLLEILISVGIVSVGLLAVASVIPVGGYYATKGQRIDESAALGKLATAEFSIRGMGQFSNWTSWNTTTGAAISPIPPGVLPIDFFKWSFAIDPLFVVVNPLDGASPPPTFRTNFPYSVFSPTIPVAIQPRMRRLSLSQYSGGGGILGAGPDGVLGNANDLISECDEMFSSKDSLAIQLPIDTTQSPIQVGSDRRKFDSKLTWFATLVPRLTSASGQSMIDMASNGWWYRLSVVVVNSRVLPMSEGIERIVGVNQALSGSGYGGGEMALESTLATDLAVREGDWIMLGRKMPPSPAAMSSAYDYANFGWYRVVAADPELEQSGGVYRRYVTLLGSDWSFDLSSPTQYPTTATLMTGVVAVYERTIRLEGASLWGN